MEVLVPLGAFAFYIILIVVVVLAVIFTFWMFVHSIILTIYMRQDNSETVMNILLIVLIFFLEILGAIVYYFVRYRHSQDFRIVREKA